jgi:[NiFe] hydrogenase diaphorase moiety large subunit
MQGVEVLNRAAPEDLTAALLAETGSDPTLLVQYLHQLQLQYSQVPDSAVRILAQRLGLSEAHVRGVIGFYSFLHDTPRGDYDVRFSDSITDHMLGSRSLLHDLCGRLGVDIGVPRADGRVTVSTTSCTGMCDQGPAILVNGRAVTRLDNHRIQSIAALIEHQTPLDEWPAAYFRVEDNIHRKDLLLVVVCNADEGEPGTFKDRVLLSLLRRPGGRGHDPVRRHHQGASGLYLSARRIPLSA